MLDDTRTATRWWAGKPFLIILVAGGFHFGRGAPVDGAIFLATAAALAFAEPRICGYRPLPRRPRCRSAG